MIGPPNQKKIPEMVVLIGYYMLRLIGTVAASGLACLSLRLNPMGGDSPSMGSGVKK
jgi:hypothetical protein